MVPVRLVRPPARLHFDRNNAILIPDNQVRLPRKKVFPRKKGLFRNRGMVSIGSLPAVNLLLHAHQLHDYPDEKVQQSKPNQHLKRHFSIEAPAPDKVSKTPQQPESIPSARSAFWKAPA